ncbi:MAG: hypothetical protein LBJ21_06545 [Acidobacteriota bacterium]|jgi:hypothetical protein|nr:hypothetical protein [Acidobacteriota bacterium]
MKKIVFGTALIMLMACFAFGADVDGEWTTEIPGMDGSPMVVNFTFKADGDKLTGSTGSDGMEIPISEGKIDGKNISFVVTIDFGMEMRMTYKGTVEGKEIKLNMDMGMGEPMSMTLKKAK